MQVHSRPNGRRVFSALGALLLIMATFAGACSPAAPATGQTAPPTVAQAPPATPQPVAPQTNAPPTLKKVRLGLSPYPDLIPVMIGVEKGWYKENGIDLDIKFLEWGETIDALAGGSLDLTNVCDTDVITRNDNFPDEVFTNLVFWSAGSGVLARPNSGLKSFDEFMKEFNGDRDKALAATGAQLKGKTAIAAHNTDHELTIMILARRGGLDPAKDIKWIDMTPAEGLAAFIAGTGDIYNGGIPQRLKGVELGYKLLLALKDLRPEGVNFCGFSTTKTYMENNMDVLTAFQRVAYMNHLFIKEHQDEAFAIMRKNLLDKTGQDTSIEQFKLIWTELEYFPVSGKEMVAQVLTPGGDWYWRPRFELAAKFYKDSGLLKNEVPIDQVAAFVKVHEEYMKQYEP